MAAPSNQIFNPAVGFPALSAATNTTNFFLGTATVGLTTGLTVPTSYFGVTAEYQAQLVSAQSHPLPGLIGQLPSGYVSHY